MAIMTMPMIECEFDGFMLPDSFCAAAGGLNSFYVRWLESAGIRVVPLPWDAPFEHQVALARCCNGILFPGGDLDHFGDVLDAYFQRVKRLYELALQWNSKGDRFVLWGTCQGFQLLCACAAGSIDVIEPGFVGTSTKMMPVSLTAHQPASRFLGAATTPAHVISSFADAPSTLNFHRFGVSPDSFACGESGGAAAAPPGTTGGGDVAVAASPKWPGLGAAFVPLSTNVDDNGRAFVSIMEHRTAPFYGVQFHPEWPPFDFSDERIPKTPPVIAVSLYCCQFLLQALRCNNNKHYFPTAKLSEKAVVERCPVVYEGFGWEMYWVQATAKEVPAECLNDAIQQEHDLHEFFAS